MLIVCMDAPATRCPLEGPARWLLTRTLMTPLFPGALGGLLSEVADFLPAVAGASLRSPSVVRHHARKVLGEARLLQQKERPRQKLLQPLPRAALCLLFPRSVSPLSASSR